MVSVMLDGFAGSYMQGVPTTSLGDVLVVAEQKADSLLMCDLLLRAGYRTSPCNDIAALAAGVSEHQRDQQYYASVICHREVTSEAMCSSLVSNVPGSRVLVLSDCIAEQTVVPILDSGAHHVFNLRESRTLIQVRLEAALRQHGRLARKSFMHGDIHFDVQKRRVSRGGKPVDLSPKEYDLANYIFSNRERVVCNRELMTSVWSLPPGMDTRRIDTAACRVRKKLRLVEKHGWELKRIRRVGYRLIRIGREEAPIVKSTAFTGKLVAVAG